MQDTVIHHGVMFSYYSAKTRAYLAYKRIPFVEQYSAPDMQTRIREVIHKVMIPVVEMPDGEILQDTTAIIDELESRYAQRPVLPEDPVMMLITRLVEFTMDELWISTAMNTRWNDPESNAFVKNEFSTRIGGSAGMSGDDARKIGEQVANRMQSYLPYLGVGSSEGQRTANNFFREASRRLNNVVSATRFALGKRPTLIDFSLFTGYYAHQYRDLGEAQRFLKGETPDLCYYLDNLHVGSCLPETGELTISDPLREYLDYIGPASSEFARGVQKGTIELASGIATGEILEQGFAPFGFDLGGNRFERGGSTFSYWKLQRVRDVYRTLGADQKATANEILDATGWNDVLEDEPGFRLDRVDHQIRMA